MIDNKAEAEQAYREHLLGCVSCRVGLCEQGHKLWAENEYRPAYIANAEIGSQAEQEAESGNAVQNPSGVSSDNERQSTGLVMGREPLPEPEGESANAYSASVIGAITKELIGPVERERLDKTPWARSIVTELLRRIANLRALLTTKPTSDLPASYQQRLYDECVTAGWDSSKQNTFAEEIAHLHEELSEAFRAWRLHKDFEIRHGANGKPEGIPIELADVLIGLFYNAELHGFDLFAAVEEKHQFNLTRNYMAEGRQLHGE